jgi:hypothetical protein
VFIAYGSSPVILSVTHPPVEVFLYYNSFSSRKKLNDDFIVSGISGLAQI